MHNAPNVVWSLDVLLLKYNHNDRNYLFWACYTWVQDFTTRRWEKSYQDDKRHSIAQRSNKTSKEIAQICSCLWTTQINQWINSAQ